MFDVLGFCAGELLVFLERLFFSWVGLACWGAIVVFLKLAVWMARSFVLVSCVFLERCRLNLEQKRKDHVDFGQCVFGYLEPKCVDSPLCVVCGVWVFIAGFIFST